MRLAGVSEAPKEQESLNITSNNQRSRNVSKADDADALQKLNILQLVFPHEVHFILMFKLKIKLI